MCVSSFCFPSLLEGTFCAASCSVRITQSLYSSCWGGVKKEILVCVCGFPVEPDGELAKRQETLHNPGRANRYPRYPPWWTWCSCSLYLCVEWRPSILEFWPMCHPHIWGGCSWEGVQCPLIHLFHVGHDGGHWRTHGTAVEKTLYLKSVMERQRCRRSQICQGWS